jgi:hypothetical protein
MVRECKCHELGLRPNMTYEELFELVKNDKYCTAGDYNVPGYMCPTMDKELRRADTERQRRKWYSKRLQSQGLTKHEADNKPLRHRRRKGAQYKEPNLVL